MELAVIKAKAKAGEASLIVKARCGSRRKAKAGDASLIVKARCGSKRKAGEDGGGVIVKAKAAEEEAAAFTTVNAKSEEEVKANAEEVEDSDQEDEWDDEEFMARMRADHAAHVEKMEAEYPTIKYGDYDPKVCCHRPDPEQDAWNLQKYCIGLAEIATGRL
uniref:Uncharacterized protein n=1 Tax=Hordeum vulgare subsp. vulgare TaxID=112509 RepID=A0A8I6WTX0_HORVV